MLIEFSLLYALCILFRLKENNHSRPALSDGPAFIIYERREDEEGDFYNSRVSPTFSNKSLCLR